jgi:hypothetical protein
MIRATVAFAGFLSATFLSPPQDKQPPLPSFESEVVRTHEIRPHGRTIPIEGVTQGFNQLPVTLVASPNGDVIRAEAEDQKDALGGWPELEGEVRRWRFEPFETHGKAGIAEV